MPKSEEGDFVPKSLSNISLNYTVDTIKRHHLKKPLLRAYFLDHRGYNNTPTLLNYF